MNEIQFGMQEQVIHLISPVDLIATDAASPFVNLARAAGKITFILPFGTVNSDTCDVTVEVATANSTVGLTNIAVPFYYRLGGLVSSSDTWGAVTSADSTGVGVGSADSDKLLVIQYDPAENSDYQYVRLQLTTGGSMGACEVAAIAVFRPRYAGLDNLTTT